MADDDFQILSEKEIKRPALSENESRNSSEMQEINNDEYYMGNTNLATIKKKDNQMNSNNNDDDEFEDIEGDNEDGYIAMIEGLENELLIEQNITKSLQKDPNLNEEIKKLKTELNMKNNQLEKLKEINKKQEKTMTEFRKKLNKETNKNSINNKVIINDENNKNLSMKKNKEVSKNEALNNSMKKNNSVLMNNINKMNYLKKENEELKKIIHYFENNFNNSYNKNSGYENSSQKNIDKIQFLQNEIKILNKQLIEHNKCIDEQNIVNKEYNHLKNELKYLKNNNQDINNKIKEFEKKILNIEINDINNNSNINNDINNLTMRKNNMMNVNISQKRQSSIKNNMFSRTLPKSQKPNLLPIISIKPLVPNSFNFCNKNNSILTDDFLKKIKIFFNNNENDYYTLVNKIKLIEKNGKSKASKNTNFRKININKYNTQLSSFNNNKNIINIDGKENDYNIKLINDKINKMKDEIILQDKKNEELQKYLNNIKTIEQKNDSEIATLLKSISSKKAGSKTNGK